MAKFFAATDADPAVLSDKTIAVIGYGNQGRAHQIVIGLELSVLQV